MFGLFRAPNQADRKPGLDLIRGLAIFLVLLRHAGVLGGAGIVGVVMFFALSGYLITGLLIRSLGETGRIDYRRFYLHRAFRLIPALVFMLAIWAAIEAVWNPLGDRPKIGRSLFTALTYTENIPGFDHGSINLSHLWTLATEEQFYLLWPLVLTLGVRFGKTRLFTLLSLVAILGACVASIILVYPLTYKVYTLPTSWMAAMLIGAAAKLGEARLDRIIKGRRRVVAGISLAALMIISVAPEMKDWPGAYFLIGPLVAIGSVGLIFELKSWQTLPSKWLKPMLNLGMISYAAYLWNYPIVNWIGNPPRNMAEGLATISLTLIAAIVSWYLIERPAANLRNIIDRRKADRLAATPKPKRAASTMT
ncbi:hypothetical protein BMF89_14310 [Arthrobacter sp. SRS-W-1-2016]|jgi:peptidoglycan/LPS O-acetylase OafA/YrhL|uniref:acyltransferase family protein n=1 Tax=Arthrobacter sp. SRS-W-1-2016 TaxID=1930254 RepID=UPI00099105F2|nr:acyltransferase [Arthrobacter sp. SRS-W-1-2016]OOP61010.1 hypothetical protein BMF89_14310 [Arthrobacter sp. SRS-W-1-2016]